MPVQHVGVLLQRSLLIAVRNQVCSLAVWHHRVLDSPGCSTGALPFAGQSFSTCTSVKQARAASIKHGRPPAQAQALLAAASSLDERLQSGHRASTSQPFAMHTPVLVHTAAGKRRAAKAAMALPSQAASAPTLQQAEPTAPSRKRGRPPKALVQAASTQQVEPAAPEPMGQPPQAESQAAAAPPSSQPRQRWRGGRKHFKAPVEPAAGRKRPLEELRRNRPRAPKERSFGPHTPVLLEEVPLWASNLFAAGGWRLIRRWLKPERRCPRGHAVAKPDGHVH